MGRGKGYRMVNSVLGLLIKPNVYATTNTVVNIAHICISLVDQLWKPKKREKTEYSYNFYIVNLQPFTRANYAILVSIYTYIQLHTQTPLYLSVSLSTYKKKVSFNSTFSFFFLDDTTFFNFLGLHQLNAFLQNSRNITHTTY